MKTLIAGGAGFIGSHLCQELLKLGHQVLCVDNLITGRKDNIQTLLADKNFKFLEKDITIIKSSDISEKIDYIFNLASPASPVDYQKYPIETLCANSMGTKNLLDLAVQHKAKFLLASTSEVYGDPLVHPQKEDYWGNVNPVGPRSCYDEAKRFAEAITMAYLRKKNIDVRIVRIFNTYGPRMKKDDGRVVSNFIYQAIHHNPITVYGKGSQTRSFCYVSDMVSGLIKALLTSGTKGEIINLGNPTERTILEFAKIIKQLTNSSSEIIFNDLPIDDPLRRRPDITKAQRFLKWEPKINLNQGLMTTINYFKDFYA